MCCYLKYINKFNTDGVGSNFLARYNMALTTNNGYLLVEWIPKIVGYSNHIN